MTLEVVDGFLEISPLDTLKVTAENVVKRYDGASYGVEAIPSEVTYNFLRTLTAG